MDLKNYFGSLAVAMNVTKGRHFFNFKDRNSAHEISHFFSRELAQLTENQNVL